VAERTYAERVQTWNVPEVPGVTLGRVEDTNRGWELCLDRYLFALIGPVPGRSPYQVRGVPGALIPGAVYLLQPGDTFRVDEGGNGGSSTNLLIPTETVAEAAREMDPSWDKVGFPSFEIRDDALASLMADCADSFSESGSVLERQSAFSELLHYVLTRHAGRSPEGNTERFGGAVEKAEALIRQRLAEPLSIQELADAAGLPRFKFMRAFRRRTALSPHTYQIKARVACAQELLQKGASLSDAAAAAGFADQSHFTRHFKKTYGKTPGEFWKRG
jgi:AraC-like DNA-binding protein